MIHVNLFIPETNRDQKTKIVSELTKGITETLNMSDEAKEGLTMYFKLYKKADLAVNGKLLDNKSDKMIYVLEVHTTMMPYETKKQMAHMLTECFSTAMKLNDEQRRRVRVTFVEHQAHNIALGGTIVEEMHLVTN